VVRIEKCLSAKIASADLFDKFQRRYKVNPDSLRCRRTEQIYHDTAGLVASYHAELVVTKMLESPRIREGKVQ